MTTLLSALRKWGSKKPPKRRTVLPTSHVFTAMPPVEKPRSLELLLTNKIVPTAADWKRANEIFDHPYKCNCSTCSLVAYLGREIRDQEGLK